MEKYRVRVTYICYSKLTLFIQIFKRQYCGNNLALIQNIFKASFSFVWEKGTRVFSFVYGEVPIIFMYK